MKYRLESNIDQSTAAAIDAFVTQAPNAHYTQHTDWTSVPSGIPHSRYLFFIGEDTNGVRLTALVRLRQMPTFGFSLADVFSGPMADSLELLLEGLSVLEEKLRPMKLLALRIDPVWSGEDGELLCQRLASLGYRPVAGQCPLTKKFVIDIDREPEKLLSSFRRQGRNNVRKAQRLRMQVQEDLDDAGLEMFQEIRRQMEAAKRIHAMPAGYFRGIRDYLRAWPQRGFILSSWMEQELLGVIVIFTLGSQAIYGTGGSSLNYPGIPKTPLLHYIAMQRARARGCTVYDIGGTRAGLGDAEHNTSLQQMHYFKHSFGGREVDVTTAHERILRPVSYHVIRSAKRGLALFR